jgi:YegS/Rv2252/BmrU family lipid kinase
VLSLIVNPVAGGGRAAAALPAVRSALDGQGAEHRVAYSESLEHVRILAAGAAAAGETAVAFGGDGTVSAVAGALQGGAGVLGVLPGGRGNDFARALGLPPDPVAACAVLTAGEVRALDLGLADKRTFVGIASCGFDSEANRIANAATVVRGSLVYSYAALRALAAWRPASFTIELDGRTETLIGYTVAVANSGTYGHGMELAPGALLDDGVLEVVMIEQMSKLRFLRALPKVFSGRHVDVTGFRIERARSVRVSADRPMSVYADGDPISTLPVRITVLPGAVRALVPLGHGGKLLRGPA